jgi:hypothetical protein
VEYSDFKLEMIKDGFRWSNDKLKIAVRVKKAPDETMPKVKAELEVLWNNIRDRPTLTCSPYNSDDEEDKQEDPNSLEEVVNSNDCIALKNCMEV